MKNNVQRNVLGFTIVELVMVVGIFAVIVGAAMSGWLYVMVGERRTSIQNELDVDVRNAMEFLKRDLRLSALDHVVFYPDGVGPYEALSFPKAYDDDADGLVELDADGKIIWDETIIYHVWNASPNQLRITTFNPRNNSLTDAQRYEQLEDVVTVGNGSTTHNSANTYTWALFENLFDWEIHGKGAIFDGYSDTVDRETDVVLGSVLLDAGTHTFKFTALEKNVASSGYKLGLDRLVVSPSGSQREGEWQSVTEEIGASSFQEYMPAGSWSGNYQLQFPATAPGATITLSMDNDRWEESNFVGGTPDNTELLFDYDSSPIPQWVVRLDGDNWDWDPADQTKDYYAEPGQEPGEGHGDMDDDYLSGMVMRTIIKGHNLAGNILNEGTDPWILLWPSDEEALTVEAVYMAETRVITNGVTGEIEPTADTVGPVYPIYLWGDDYYTYPVTLDPPSWNGEWVGEWFSVNWDVNWPIDDDKSYSVTVVVGTDPDEGNATWWEDTTDPGAVNTFVIPTTGTVADAQDSTWDGRGDLDIWNEIAAVSGLWVEHVTNGTFTSDIFDTHMTAPPYNYIEYGAENDWWANALTLRVRSGSNADMSDAPDWTNAPIVTSSSGPPPGGLANLRYVQWQAEMTTPPANNWDTPYLQYVVIGWDGPEQIVDIAATYTKAPDYGIWELTVDDKPLVKGITVNLEIYEDVTSWGGESMRLTSFMTEEIEPRNTGK